MKNIKYLFIIQICMVISLPAAFSQKDSSGIYKTAEDFEHRKLSYAINCKLEKHTINPYVIFKASKVKVKHEGTKSELKKSELFGYRACDGNEYKFVNKEVYTILNPGEQLIIYLYKHRVHPARGASQYPPKLYFSKDATSPLLELTRANLKSTYSDNHRFHDALDAEFKSDDSLHAYDTFHKMYKLNWLLIRSFE